MNAQGSTIKETNISSIKASNLTVNQQRITLDIPSSKNPSIIASSLPKLPDSIAIDIDRQGQGQATCPICLGDYLPEELKRSLKCKHAFCSACLTEYLNVKINNNEVLDILCPQSGCQETFPRKSVKKIIPPKQYKRYQDMVTRKMILQGQKENYCPQPGCLRPVKLVEGQKATTCECGAKICNACHNLSHEGTTCLEAINTDFEKYAKENGVKFCMMCKTIVIKETGCNVIKCAVCDYKWCWICGRELDLAHLCPREWDPIPPASIRKDGTLMTRFKKRWKEASFLKRIGICLGIFLLSPLLFFGLLIFLPAHFDGCLNLNTFEFKRRKLIESVCMILGAMLYGLLILPYTIIFIIFGAIFLAIFYVVYGISLSIQKMFGFFRKSTKEPPKPQLKTRWRSRDPENFTYRPTNNF